MHAAASAKSVPRAYTRVLTTVARPESVRCLGVETLRKWARTRAMQAQNQKKFPKFFGGSKRETRPPRSAYQRAVSLGGSVLDRPFRGLRGALSSTWSVGLRECGLVTACGSALTPGDTGSQCDLPTWVRCAEECSGREQARELALFFEKNRQPASPDANVGQEACNGQGPGALGTERSARRWRTPDTHARIQLSSARCALSANVAIRQRSPHLRCSTAQASRQERRAARRA